MSEKRFFQFRNFNILSSYSTHNITQKFCFFLAVTNLKYKNYTNFYKFLLLLLDVSLNPGQIQRSPDLYLDHMGTTQQERFTFSTYKD